MSQYHVPSDWIFRGACVIDGTGAATRVCDVAVSGDRITAVGQLDGFAAPNEFDARKLALAPGFIDAHAHDDALVLTSTAMAPKVAQGVTTAVIGNCGISIPPLELDNDPPPPLDLLGDSKIFRFSRFAEYVDAIEYYPAAINVAPMVGHTSLRIATMAALDRAATGREIRGMQRLLEEALDAGAIGFSTGLYYPPARSAPASEVIELLKMVAAAGAVYTTHMRDEGDGVEESLRESFETARTADVPLVISHHKCQGRQNHGRSITTLAMIDEARQAQQISLDAYPYIAGSTTLLAEQAVRSDRVLITWSRPHPELKGCDLAHIANQWKCSIPEAIERMLPAGAIYFNMSEDDVRRILSYQFTMIGSDGIPQGDNPHPRLWGTFPRVLGHYVRELRLMSIEKAVYKMAGLPAATFRLTQRGTVAPGFYADLVLFDPQTIADQATFESPTRRALGIRLVMVNGKVVLLDGQQTTERPGRVLKRTAATN
jgi:N-acyl-D-amino-acid deacylase